MKNPNSQHTLFRFISLRSPELSKTENQDKRFIFFSSLTTSSRYFNAVSNRNSLTKWEAMKATTPEKVLDIEDIKEVYNEFYTAAVWLSEHKNNLQGISLKRKSPVLLTIPILITN